MKSFLKFSLVIGFISLAAVLLSPILYEVLPWDFKFERIFNRIIMIGVLLAVVAFVRIRRETIQRFGLIWSKKSFPDLSFGFACGVGVLLLLGGAKFLLGSGVWAPKDMSILEILGKIGFVFCSAMIIGVIEEFFFRGFIFDAFQKRFRFNLILSMVFTNVFYALIHFVSYRKPFIDDTPNFSDSFHLLISPFLQLRFIDEFWPAALGLFIFGIVLNILFCRTNSLFASIGLHAGCVFFLKMDGSFVDFPSNQTILYTSSKMYDGVLGWVFLTLLGFFVYFTVQQRHLHE